MSRELGPCPGLVYEPAPCPTCGARNDAAAVKRCRPSSDETGEVFCAATDAAGPDGLYRFPTKASLDAMDAWISAAAAAFDDEPAA